MGCSKGKSVEVKWDYGTLSFNGSTAVVDKYTGTTAQYIDDEMTINYYSCEGPDNCSHNLLGIGSDVMTKHNKNAYYYTAFFDTTVALYVQNNGQWGEGILNVEEGSGYPVGTLVEKMYQVLNTLPMGGVDAIVINDSVKLNTIDNAFEARADCVVVPGFIKVGTDDGSITMSSTRTYGDKTVGFTSTTKFDYYQYKNVLIQAAVGSDITAYVTFL